MEPRANGAPSVVCRTTSWPFSTAALVGIQPSHTVTAATMLVLVLLAVALVYSEGLGAISSTEVVTVAAAYAAVALVPLRMPRGDSVFGVVGVVVASIALVPGSAVLAGAALGSVVVSLVLSREQPLETFLGEAIRQPTIAAAVALMFPYLTEAEMLSGAPGALPWALLVAAAVYVFLDLFAGAVASASGADAGVWDSLTGSARLLGGMQLALASVGVVLAIVFPTMGLVGGLVLVTLMALMKLSFGMYLRARAAYPKTVAVLARLAETEMQETHGHAERVAELATAVGKRMRLGNRAVERLGLAALLHDIGKVKTGELHDDGEHARVGAELLEQIEFLSDLAPIVGGHHSRTADAVIEDDDLLAHVLYVVSYYDLQVQERPGADVLTEMRGRQGTDFDPRVVTALSQVCC
jgi:putative nucleotidyltransferase with HDIG domain